ncbi:MAG: hypothetical protein QM715_18275 [Nibricoccus sp.]
MNTASPLTPFASPSALYTPFQVGLASFIGGPFAAVYTLYCNFKRLGKVRETQFTLYLGGAFLIAILAVLPFLPDKFPNMVIPVAYTFAAVSIASSKQLSKEQILASENYVRRSGGNVAVVCVVSFLGFFAIMLSVLFALDHWGIVSLE